MKINLFLTAGLLSLGLTASALAVEDINFNVPGESSQADKQAAAPSYSVAPTPADFTADQISEEFGWFLAKRSGAADLHYSHEEVAAMIKGFAAALNEQPDPYDLRKIGHPMDEYMRKKQVAYLQRLKNLGDAIAVVFFNKLKEDKDVVTLPSGLRYKIIAPGDGPYPKADDAVVVNYAGTLVDGSTFDKSKPGGATMSLSQVIPGWTEGLQKINRGGKIRLFIPASLGYGDAGSQGIPPASVLIFDVELLDIKPAGSVPAAGPATPDVTP